MSTPLHDAVARYLEKNRARFHMPGHKGRPLPVIGEAARWDITEVEGADSLYEAEAAIAETEREYAKLYGAQASFLSAGGSTLCIQAMLALACPPGSKILCVRGAHTASMNAIALLDLHPVWAYPDIDPDTGLARAVTPEQIEAVLQEHPDAAAVYLTSPTYFGVISDIAAISRVCRTHSVPLLVDNAHGAHLRFLRPDLHPMGQGADLCCDSLHKTLPVITGGAVLHVGNRKYIPDAKAKMALFGSTSPSYLILLSADTVLDYIKGDFPGNFAGVCGKLDQLRQTAKEREFLLPGGVADPMRLALGAAPLGHTGEQLARHLRNGGVEPEYCGDGFCVLMAAPGNSDEDFRRLENAIVSLEKKAPLSPVLLPQLRPVQVLSPRQAVFSRWEEVPVEAAEGRIAGSSVAPCPPGIPMLIPGEQIGKEAVALLKKVGFSTLNVLK